VYVKRAKGEENKDMKPKQGSQPILVPVDFSAHSKAALLKACDLSECTGDPLLVLHVVHDPAEMPGYYGQVTKKKKLVRIEDLARESFNEFMKATVAEHPDVKRLKKVEQMLVVGLPVSRIMEVAKKRNASMVVMGSQGRTGLKHVFLGSKAEQVVRLCPVPVLIVKMAP
jgi:nucleotide-binding universal stress UspA family protein